MKSTFPLLAAIVALLPAVAYADEKADAILKEVRLHMRNTTAYSVTLTMEEDNQKVPARIRFMMQRPDKYRVSLSELNEPETIIIVNGNKATARQSGATLPISTKNGLAMVDSFLPMLSGNFERWIEGIKSTQYVTQKMLDETTVVDVIDLVSAKDSTIKFRVYVDNNSLIRKIAATGKDKSMTMHFLNPTTNPVITEQTFAVK